ncbi:glycosyltransferase family 1 protein [Candidatus Accumulibacter sp. ACC003]|uniref:glycosyltransferase family 4 protein n=1 Tax=Candidatus Accumulibacter sp. ACC003 TaxID=2823334 RepID=UPI0025B9472C|nr:glycosyltransferase family 1 protein [Candidatus Accumulibacter sp. ACC003]
MKIVVNAYSARIGGGQTYLRNLFAHLPARADLEVLIFAPASLQLPAHPQVRRVHAPWPASNPLARAFWERWVLPGFLRREQADLLFCPGGVVATRAPANCKVVGMFRNMIPFDDALVRSMPWGLQRVRNLILKRVLLRSLSEADLTIFISDHARAVIEELVRIPNPVTIPHGINDSFRCAADSLPRPELAPPGDYLLYVSRFDVYKHHRELVSAFAALPEALRAGLQLVFLGETDMPEAEPVARLVQELALADQVLMPGAVPYATLPAWYQHARANLFASSCENCPNILLEAMAAGRPVLSSNVMPMPEFGGSEIAYFSPDDPQETSRALARLLSDSDYSEQIAQAALRRSGLYDWRITARETWTRLIQLSEQNH